VLDILDKHHDANAFVRASTLAWTQAQVQLRHLGISAVEASLFQRLAGHVLFADATLRSSSDTIRRGSGGPAGLWSQGISGDLPIVLLRIGDVDDIAIARQLLQAHEYWRLKQLAVDLVILNERAASYVQDLQIALETLVRTSQSCGPEATDRARGCVYILRTDLIPAETQALLASVARVVLVGQRGSLADQLDRTRRPSVATPGRPSRGLPPGDSVITGPAPQSLEFFNGLGGFAANGAEYVTLLGPGQSTPAPWVNVIANPAFGFQVAAEGSGFTWSVNSRENQLTPWSNDPVTDRPGEVIYLRDEESGEVWGPTAAPAHDPGAFYSASHGQGYSRFTHESRGVALDLLMYVPLGDSIKISQLRIRNTSGRARRLSVTAYVEWVLGPSRAAGAPFIVTEMDTVTGAMFARNPWNAVFGSRVAFADLAGRQTQWTADRREFVGRHGTLAAPAALLRAGPLARRVGAGLDPCGALQTSLALDAGETVQIVFLLGEAADSAAAQALVGRYRGADLDAVFISHGHHDHFDPPSLRRIPGKPTVIVPRGFGRLAARLGLGPVEEVEPGDRLTIDRVHVEAVHAEHSGRREPFGPDGPAMGCVVAGSKTIYFPGDTDLFPAMGALAGRLDVALLPVWGWGPTIGEGHMNPERAAAAAAILRPGLAIPIHWGTFYPAGLRRMVPKPFDEPGRDFEAAAARLAPDVPVRILAPGEALDVPHRS